MKYQKAIIRLAVCIILLSFIAAAIGVFSSQGSGEFTIQSIRGEEVKIYGMGIYQHDSVTTVAQAIPQDVVTMALGIPLLIISLYLKKRGMMKGRFLLTGTLGYFLYTYVSYTFLSMYNPLFLIYVAAMSTSFFAFTLSLMSFDLERIASVFDEKLPVKLIGGFQIFIGAAFGLMWIGRIVPSLIQGGVPVGLEHYTTLVIQAMDLGFVIPVLFISGILIIKRRVFGYLLSPVMIIKGITMSTSLTAMIIGQALMGVQMTFVEIAISILVNLFTVYFLFLILKNIHEVA